MLNELQNQNPLEPQDTSKLVENMQKLQDLANTTFTKFRNDIRWAQDLVGKQVEVQQVQGTPKQIEAWKNKNLVPDVGYLPVTGTVEGFRVVDESVWITIGGKQYPADNVKQVQPETAQQNSARLFELAGASLGRGITWYDQDDKAVSAKVTDVRMDAAGQVLLIAGGQTVPWSAVKRISAL
jgi:flagellar hook assembly protein FlgD